MTWAIYYRSLCPLSLFSDSWIIFRLPSLFKWSSFLVLASLEEMMGVDTDQEHERSSYFNQTEDEENSLALTEDNQMFLLVVRIQEGNKPLKAIIWRLVKIYFCIFQALLLAACEILGFLRKETLWQRLFLSWSSPVISLLSSLPLLGLWLIDLRWGILIWILLTYVLQELIKDLLIIRMRRSRTFTLCSNSLFVTISFCSCRLWRSWPLSYQGKH